MRVVKSGWVYKYSDGTFIGPWKRRYLILFDDGHLSIFKKPKEKATPPEEKIAIQKECKQLITGYQCYKWKSINFPKGVQELDALFCLKLRRSAAMEDYTFAASNKRECMAWVDVLQKAQENRSMLDIFAASVMDN
eukprot:Seg2075.6 transcript_id=Seg2075.6/GoldUCD/mRNA.D3Y31 product="Pleckstrin-like domain-containing family B member 2" protein_id=Seg2075.6/GoldUCD/D3Y31